MPDQELHKDQYKLIVRYLSGNATDAEVQQLEAWVLADPEHRRQFTVLKKAWMLGGMAREEEGIDVEAQWRQMSSEVWREEKVVALQPRPGFRRWAAFAAGMTLVAAISVWALLYFGGEKDRLVRAKDAVQSIELADGSTVTLNRNSTLRYGEIAGGPDTEPRRQLTLEGDAFFDIVRDTARPFVIRTDKLEVEVLGTSFYIDARDGQPETEVIVESGSVAVRANAGDSLRLVAGQKAVYAKAADSLLLQNNEDVNFSSIKTDTLIFNNSSLPEVAFALARHYGVEVLYTGVQDLSNCEINTDFFDFTLDEVLKILEETWNIETQVNGATVRFSGTGCE